jgi:hypothetical protein
MPLDTNCSLSFQRIAWTTWRPEAMRRGRYVRAWTTARPYISSPGQGDFAAWTSASGRGWAPPSDGAVLDAGAAPMGAEGGDPTTSADREISGYSAQISAEHPGRSGHYRLQGPPSPHQVLSRTPNPHRGASGQGPSVWGEPLPHGSRSSRMPW